jgi:hypothetical protein
VSNKYNAGEGLLRVARVLGDLKGDQMIQHANAVTWAEAPIPRRLHRCRRQTVGVVRFFTLIERCACGAARIDGGPWIEKNSRRKGR